MARALPHVSIGVDLATSPRSTGVVTIDWRGARPHVEVVGGPSRRTVEAIAALVAATAREVGRGRVRVGIDAPMGWPAAWIDLLGRARSLDGVRRGESVDPGGGSTALAERLRWRLTDRALSDHTGGRVRPMTASADRLAATAARCIDLLAHLRDAGLAVDRTGARGVALEVYPSAALHAWRDCIGAGGRVAARERLLALVAGHLDGTLPAVADEHDVDALACALVAGGATLAMRPARPPRGVLAVEGVIHQPAGDAPRLA